MVDPDQQALTDAKRELRRAVRMRRRVRPDAERERDDRSRTMMIMDHVPGGAVGTVACYLSSTPEPGTLQLISWLASRSVRTLLPVLTETDDDTVSDPEWAAYDGPDALVEGPHGIVQPTTPALGPRSLAAAEMIIVPGLAANAHGDRLGRGGGWYDRALGHAEDSADVVVLLNDDEVLPVIPSQHWDQRVGAIATPTRWITCTT